MESSRKLSEIKDLHDKIRQSAEQAKKKESLYKQLVGKKNIYYILKTNSLFLCTYSVICFSCLCIPFPVLLIQITEYETLPKDVSRSAYTMRILEIVGNIKKQKEEITKVFIYLLFHLCIMF